MEAAVHTLSHLFAQLGLPADGAEVGHFIDRHGPLPAGLALAEAPFWTSAQAAFLREEILDDADWAEAIDELDSRLRA